MTGALVGLLCAVVVVLLLLALGMRVGKALRGVAARQALPQRIDYTHLTGEDVDWIERQEMVAGVRRRCDEPRCTLLGDHPEHVVVARSGARLLRIEHDNGSVQYTALDGTPVGGVSSPGARLKPPNPGREVRS